MYIHILVNKYIHMYIYNYIYIYIVYKIIYIYICYVLYTIIYTNLYIITMTIPLYMCSIFQLPHGPTMEIGFHHTTGTAEGPAAGTAVCGYLGSRGKSQGFQ